MTNVKQIKITKDDNDIRLDRWFKRHYPNVTHGVLEKALRKGQVKVNGKKAVASQHVLTGDEIRVPPLQERKPSEKRHVTQNAKLNPEDIKAIKNSVIYKDDEIIAINKPAGLAVQGGVGVAISVDSLLDHLKFDYEERPKLVHRIDKDTSGLLLLARKTSVASKLTKQFRDKEIEKTYWAIVVGVPEEKSGRIDLPILKRDSGAGKEKMVADDEGDAAVTLYRVLENMGGRFSLLELKPITGKTHQLRVHMEAIGHPILGDGKYGGRAAFISGMSKKMHLHAREVILPEKNLTITAELQGHMKETFEMLEL